MVSQNNSTADKWVKRACIAAIASLVILIILGIINQMVLIRLALSV